MPKTTFIQTLLQHKLKKVSKSRFDNTSQIQFPINRLGEK